MSIDQLFYWCGAVIGISGAVIAACCAAIFSAWLIKKTCNYWWEHTLTIYRLESLRHYFKIMVDNRRTGLLKEVEASKAERNDKEQPQ